MKSVSSILILPLLALYGRTASAQITSPSAFLDAYRDAVQSKSVPKLDDLAWRSGMTDSDKQTEDHSLQKQLERLTVDGADISFAPLPKDFVVGGVSLGKRRESTYPPVGMIKIMLHSEHEQTTTIVPYAIINGAYYLTQVRSSDVGWNGPRDHVFVIQVKSTNTAGVEISVTWNSSGVEQKHTYPRSIAVVTAQYVETAAATIPSDSAKTTLVIRKGEVGQQIGEDVPPIFQSQPLEGKGILTYTKS